jgi:hypothetical protein
LGKRSWGELWLWCYQIGQALQFLAWEGVDQVAWWSCHVTPWLVEDQEVL